MDLAKIDTVENEGESRFELTVDSFVAFVQYKIGTSGQWYLVHTEVPEQVKSLGVGNKLVRETLNLLEAKGVKIVPTCPFVRAFMKRHEEDYRQLLAPGVTL